MTVTEDVVRDAWGDYVNYRDCWEKEFDAWLEGVKEEAYQECYEAMGGF